MEKRLDEKNKNVHEIQYVDADSSQHGIWEKFSHIAEPPMIVPPNTFPRLVAAHELVATEGLTLKVLAEACHEGKLSAFSRYDGRRIWASSQCQAKLKFPDCYFEVQIPLSFCTIAIHSRTLKDCHIYIGGINSKIYYKRTDRKNYSFFNYITMHEDKIYFKPKHDVTNMYISVIMIDSNNKVISKIISNISIIQNDSSRKLLISNKINKNCELSQKIYWESLRMAYKRLIYQQWNKKDFNDRVTYLSLFIQNNECYYYIDNKEKELIFNKEYFIFDIDYYKNLFPNGYLLTKNPDQEFYDFISLLMFDKNEIKVLLKHVKELNCIQLSPIDYLKNKYNEIKPRYKAKYKKAIEAYTQKLDRYTHKEVFKSIYPNENKSDELGVINDLLRLIKDIAGENNIPYFDWKDVVGSRQHRPLSQAELTKQILDQLSNQKSIASASQELGIQIATKKLSKQNEGDACQRGEMGIEKTTFHKGM